jgi:hypothetical protein
MVKHVDSGNQVAGAGLDRELTGNGDGVRLEILVLHDDAKREKMAGPSSA